MPAARQNTKAEHKRAVMDGNTEDFSDPAYVRRLKDTPSARSALQPKQTVWDSIVREDTVERARADLSRKAKTARGELEVLYTHT